MSQRNIIFCVGHPRSGTTLIASHLSRLDNLIVLPETHFFDYSYAGNFLKRILAGKNSNRAFAYYYSRNWRLRDLKIDENLVRDDLELIPEITSSLVLRVLIEHYCKSKSGYALEKTPFHLRYMDLIKKMYPNSKILFIVRDSRAVISSLLKVNWTHSNLHTHCVEWNHSFSQYEKFSNKFPDSILLIKYEEFVSSPDEILKNVANFIGLDNYQMAHEVVDTRIVPEWETAWKQNSLGAIDSKKLESWKEGIKFSDFERISQLTSPGLEYFGYECVKPNNRIVSAVRMFYSLLWLRLKIFVQDHILGRRQAGNVRNILN